MSFVSFNVMPGSPPPPGTRTGLVVAGVAGIVAILLVAVGLATYSAVQVHRRNMVVPSSRDVASVPRSTSATSPTTAAAIRGYYSPVGTHHRPVTAGQPWGRVCEPVRITVEEHVPDSVYSQVVTVVNQARHDGIDITMENRSFRWRPTSLYYPAGVDPSAVERVGLFASTVPPQNISNGQPERLKLGWDTELQPGGQTEHFTRVQGELQLAILSGHPVAQRTAVRQLIAMTQGIVATSRPGSGITTGTTLDAFSRADVAAMKAMSGCGDTATSTVAQTSTGA